MILNEGTENEVTLRVVLSSDLHGNEYFDHHDSLDEALAAVKEIVESSIKQNDGVERIIGITVVPKSAYGAEDGFGYGLGDDDDAWSIEHNG
jgi:hypothetical protein